MIFLECDLSQIESRIGFILSKDPELIRIARLAPWEYDQHTKNAELLEPYLPVEIRADKKRTRHVGKIVSHGCLRDMHGATMSEHILSELNVYVTPHVCEGIRTAYLRMYTGIERGLFRETRERMMRFGRLVNSWGDIWSCKYARMDDELFRKGYGFRMASENGRLCTQWGVLPLWTAIHMAELRAHINNTVHDSLLTSVLPADAWDVAHFLEKSLSRPRMYEGVELSAFLEFKLGINGGFSEKKGEGMEFKRLPGRAEFTEIAYEFDRKMKEEA